MPPRFHSSQSGSFSTKEKHQKAFATELVSVWFDGDETFAIPAGDRDSVSAAVAGLRAAGVVAAEIIGLVDRDFYSEAVLNAATDGVLVLPVHEIESVLCDGEVIKAIARHLGKSEGELYEEFLRRVRKVFQGHVRSGLIARRVRARVGDLLDGAFAHNQIAEDGDDTARRHEAALDKLGIPERTRAMFSEEAQRVDQALANAGTHLLAVLPGKHLLAIASQTLGFSKTAEFTALILRSLDRRHLLSDDPLRSLGTSIEGAISTYLPPRRA